MKEGQFRWDVRDKFYSMRVVRCWTCCPGRWWHSRSGWTGLWETWSSCRCPGTLQQGLNEMTFQQKLLYDSKLQWYLEGEIQAASSGHVQCKVMLQLEEGEGNPSWKWMAGWATSVVMVGFLESYVLWCCFKELRFWKMLLCKKLSSKRTVEWLTDW